MYEMGDRWKRSSADITQSEKHGIFDGIPYYMLSIIPLTHSTPQFVFLIAEALFCVNLRNSGATLHKNITIWKHGIFRGIFQKS